jgi:hypothetical protein
VEKTCARFPPYAVGRAAQASQPSSASPASSATPLANSRATAGNSGLIQHQHRNAPFAGRLELVFGGLAAAVPADQHVAVDAFHEGAFVVEDG